MKEEGVRAGDIITVHYPHSTEFRHGIAMVKSGAIEPAESFGEAMRRVSALAGPGVWSRHPQGQQEPTPEQAIVWEFHPASGSPAGYQVQWYRPGKP